jgi:hypothetical protein
VYQLLRGAARASNLPASRRSETLAKELDPELEALKAWLNDLPPSVRELIALRHALRALPAKMETLGSREPPGTPPDSDIRKKALSVFRTTLTAISAFENREPPLLRALDAAGRGAPNYLHSGPPGFEALGAAATILANDDDDKTTAALSTLTDFEHRSSDGHPDRAILDDGRELTLTGPPITATDWPYWRHQLRNDVPSWNFWIEWYEAFLSGQSPDWEMQREIALIPNEDWEKGAEHIANCIQELRIRLEVRRRADAVVAFLDEAEPPQIGHNHPPDPIEDPPTTLDDLAQLTSAIRTVQAETRTANAEREVVEAETKEISSFLRQAATYLGPKLNMTVDAFLTNFGATAGKVVGAGVGTASTAFLLQLVGLLQPLIEAIGRWLPHLG